MGTWLMLSALALIGQSNLVSYEKPSLEPEKQLIEYVTTAVPSTAPVKTAPAAPVAEKKSACNCSEACACRNGGTCEKPANCENVRDLKPSNLQKAMTAALTSPQYTSHTASSPYAVRYVDNTRRQVWDGYRWTNQSLVRSCSGNACRSQWVAEAHYQAPAYSYGYQQAYSSNCGTASYYSPEGYSGGLRGACGLFGGACGGNARAGGRQRIPLLPWRR